MSIFTNPFFSIAGQIERIQNVGNVLLASVTKGGIKSNTNIKPLDTVLTAVANHPFITAGVAAAAVNPTAAFSATKSVASSLGTSFASSSLKTKALVVGGGIVGGNVLITSGKAREAVINTPTALANFGQNIGTFSDNPSFDTAKNIVKENPIISGIVATGAVLAAGVGIGSLANTLATSANTRAINASNTQEVTQKIDNIPSLGSPEPLNTSPLVADKSLVAPPLSQIGKPASSSVPTSNKRRTTRLKPNNQIQTNKTNVYIDGRKQNIYNKQALIHK
jgi:hypothetical protein